MNGSTGFVFQFMKPTAATSANARIIIMESAVLTLPTSFSPSRFTIVKIRIIPIFSACTAAGDIGIIWLTYPDTSAT